MDISSIASTTAVDPSKVKSDRTVNQLNSYSKTTQSFSEEVSAKIIDPKIKKPFDKKLMDTCVEMESLFVKQMFNTMRKTVHKGEMFHGGSAEEIFEDMLYDEYALNVSKNSNLGIAKKMYEQMRDYV